MSNKICSKYYNQPNQTSPDFTDYPSFPDYWSSSFTQTYLILFSLIPNLQVSHDYPHFDKLLLLYPFFSDYQCFPVPTDKNEFQIRILQFKIYKIKW